MGYNLLINGGYWGYNPLTNHLLTSCNILAVENVSWDFGLGWLFFKDDGGSAIDLLIKLDQLVV